jgi:hypothetical protein
MMLGTIPLSDLIGINLRITLFFPKGTLRRKRRLTGFSRHS